MSIIDLNTKNFFIFLKETKINPNLNLNNLPGEGRLDLICRIISSTFFLSNSFREDTNLHLFFESESILITLYGKRIKKIMPDERSVGGLLKKIFKKIVDGTIKNKNKLEFKWQYFSLEDFPKNIPNGFILDIDGIIIKKIENKKILGFNYFIGDHLGLNEKDKSFLAKFEKLSLGKNELHASNCITIIHHYLDSIES